MRALTQWLIGTFTSPGGLFLLAALDSTLLVTLPFGVDAAVVILAARTEALSWAAPCVATAGSVAGAALTFWMGAKMGDTGLDRYVRPQRVSRLRRRFRTSGAIAAATIHLMPPPFPAKLFVLTAGAMGVRRGVFFVALTATRLVRFGAESYLAVRFGNRILAWLESDLFHQLAAAFIVLTLVLTAFSLAALVRSSRSPAPRAPA